ncbi:MAG: isocitrate/isopropylmalate family dehydrogenase, partial [Caulobacteraceae bacterium]
AGQGIANPLAAILSFGMALKWSLGRPDLGQRLDAAVESALKAGARTRDLGGSLSTREMGEAVLARL